MDVALGIDFSTKALHCAYTIGADETPTIVPLRITGQQATTRVASLSDRLHSLLDRLEDLSDSHRASRLIVVERPWMGVNARSLIALSQVEGAVLCVAHQHGWQVREEDPSDIRKDVIGVGTVRGKGEIKKRVQQWVEREYGWRLDDNRADAVVIWRYARHRLEERPAA